MPDFTIVVAERPPMRCAGIMIRTDMTRANQDCPELWMNAFGPRIAEIPPNPEFADESYGASFMVDDTAFDYWAAAPLAPGADAPAGMDILELPGGWYAECRLKSVKELCDACSHIFHVWAPEQEKYAIAMQAPMLEKYTSDYMKNGSLTLYCPLVQK